MAMGEYMMRGKAAKKLLSGMPEEELPPEEMEAEAPAEELPMPEEAPSPEMEEDEALAAGDEVEGGIESSLLSIEAALADMSEEAASEIRQHIEAIREIASREDASGEKASADAPTGDAAPEEGPAPDLGVGGLEGLA